MGLKSAIKKHKAISAIIITILSLALIFCIGLIVLFTVTRDTRVKAHEAEKIAKEQFGCEKILWMTLYQARIFLGLDGKYYRTGSFIKHRYIYYIVGEKDGEEIYIAVPSHLKEFEPRVVGWNFEFTFKQIMDELNANGADCYTTIYESPTHHYDRFDLYYTPEWESSFWAAFYDDDKAAMEECFRTAGKSLTFDYRWKDAENSYGCYVWIENGELKSEKILFPKSE